MKKIIYAAAFILVATTTSSWKPSENKTDHLSVNSQNQQLSQPKPKPKTTAVDPIKALYKNGGIVVWEKNGHGLVVAESDINPPEEGMNWHDAVKACNNLVLNGHSNWRLPTKVECDSMKKLCSLKIGNLRDPNGKPVVYYYWTSTESSNIYGFHNYTGFGGVKAMSSCCGGKIYRVRPVREF
jgi:hypothetical protein